MKKEIINYKKQRRIKLKFEYNVEIITQVRTFQGARWSSTLQAWHIPDNKKNRQRLGISIFENGNLSEDVINKIEYFSQWLKSKRYSESTIRTYLDVTTVFLNFYHSKSIEQITNDDIILFNNDYILRRKLSGSYQNQFVNGIKLFFQTVENKRIDVALIQRPRAEHKLPRVLCKEEVKSIIYALSNQKHRTMLILIYACGLRCSELLNLKPSDVLSDRNLLHVYQSKGKKDRVVPISNKVIKLLREYFLAYRPKSWLFEGQEQGTQYSARSLQLVLKNAIAKTKIKKPVTLHWLRHSYATHLLESGTDIRYIQELLGHNSSRTTEIYTHVSQRSLQQIKSPFDDL